MLYGLRIIRNVTGLGGDPPQFGGGPPEAALYVGVEGTGGFTQLEPYWDNITIKNCIVEGVHDGIQCFGQGTPTSSPHPAVGQVLIQDCIIRSAHDALTMKGNMRMISKNNHIRVDSRGIAPYLTNIAPWKSTGFHMNTRDVQGPTGNDNSLFHSEHDHIWVIGSDNISTAGTDQAHVAGYLFYDLAIAEPFQAAQVLHRTRIVEPHVLVEYIQPSGTPPPGPPQEVGGIVVRGRFMNIPDGHLVVQGGSILVRQRRSILPLDAYGVLLDAQPSTGATARIVGTRIKVENVVMTSAKNSLAAATIGPNTNNTIKADVYSDESVEPGLGSILAAAHEP